MNAKRVTAPALSGRRVALMLAGLLSLVFAPATASQSSSIPAEYRRYFAHSVDRRSITEKMLNLIGLTANDLGRSFALVAGVDAYPNLQGKDRSLEAARVDVERVVAYLRDVEFFDEIVVLRNEAVTDENLKYFLQAYFPERLRGYSKSRFLFAYSGHGIQDGQRGYLLQAKARSFTDMANSIDLEALASLYRRTTEAAFHSLALINACYGGVFARRPFGDADRRLLPREPGAHVMTAGAANELAWTYPDLAPGSLFFAKIFDGLEGLADSEPRQADGSHGDGVVTVNELFSFVDQEIQVATDQRQHPTLGVLSASGQNGGFFFLNRRRQVAAGTMRQWVPRRTRMGPVAPPTAAEQRVEDSRPLTPSVTISSAAPPVELEPGAVKEGPLGMRFRFIPAGTYIIGSPSTEQRRFDNELQHLVQVTRGFWLGETEVTQDQWRRLVSENSSHFEACGGSCPAEQVSWWDAVAFANKLSEQKGLSRCYELLGCSGVLGDDGFKCESATFGGLECDGYRLPTESEWEAAARAGTQTALYTGGLTLKGLHNVPELDPIAWYGGNSGVSYDGGIACTGSIWKERQYPNQKSCGTHPVGQKAANPWGLLDMLGNVWEWTNDWQADYPSSLVVDSLGPSVGLRRAIRGGSWNHYAMTVRAAARSAHSPGDRVNFIGFRLARGQGSAK